MKTALTALVVFLSLVAGSAAARAPQAPSSSVPAFDSFHEVVMPMWHTAYPARDYAALRRLSARVDSGVAAIAAAALPPILHEKEAAWTRGLAELKAAADQYVRAAAGTDDQALLAAAERLHTTYEAQGQIIRPIVPPMGAFHERLYVVQHTYVPEKNWAAVCQSSADLHAGAEAIAAATLPKRVAARSEAFRREAAQLVADAGGLASACRVGEPAGVERAAAALHSRYEALVKIFD